MLIEAPRRRPDVLAMDRDSVRSTDEDGRLHVKVANISKANICPYRGEEIPDWERLGLKADQVYHLLRHPDELAKGAASFNNLPILSKHVPVTVDDHQPDLVVGSTGTDAKFSHPFLGNSLVVWEGDAIRRIESGQQRELSSAYRYDADMTPGEYEGAAYDGVMRNIRGNHVALVEQGRAGADVVVGDAALPQDKEFDMAKKPPVPRLNRRALVLATAIGAAIRPKLAQDAKVDLRPLFAGIKTAADWKAKRPALMVALGKAVEGKLAQDATIEDVATMLDNLEGVVDKVEDDMQEGVDPNPVAETVEEETTDDADPMAKVLEFLRTKLSDDDVAAVEAMLQPEADPADPAEDADTDADKDGKDGKGKKAPPFAKDKTTMMTKGAMDAAIAARVAASETKIKAQAKALREAEIAVRPHIGDLNMDHLAMDSAEAVYRFAFKARGVDVSKVPPEGFPALLAALPKPNQRTAQPIAMDAAGISTFDQMFPSAARFGVAN
jgi:hypothetical protein